MYECSVETNPRYSEILKEKEKRKQKKKVEKEKEYKIEWMTPMSLI